MFNNYKVILDTNFLLIPGQFHVNIFAEIERVLDIPYKLFIIDRTLEELNKISVLGKQRDVKAAKLAVALVGSLLKQKSLKTITSSQGLSVDDMIVKKANKKVYIATQDKELKNRVRKKEGKIIALKQKKYLILE
ncbi:nucleotide-binding protein [archaeon]|nr:nucleotide-binding protein [archaeon]MBL7057052.1 nucleotide-binding protein [Candidatus Woesearchaeota archaeon]